MKLFILLFLALSAYGNEKVLVGTDTPNVGDTFQRDNKTQEQYKQQIKGTKQMRKSGNLTLSIKTSTKTDLLKKQSIDFILSNNSNENIIFDQHVFTYSFYINKVPIGGDAGLAWHSEMTWKVLKPNESFTITSAFWKPSLSFLYTDVSEFDFEVVASINVYNKNLSRHVKTSLASESLKCTLTVLDAKVIKTSNNEDSPYVQIGKKIFYNSKSDFRGLEKIAINPD